MAGMIATIAALLGFVVSLFLYNYLTGNHFEAVIVNPPLLDGWLRIESIGLDIPWQLRVDSLSVTMMMIVTGVGSLIHYYSIGYMHGDPKFHRFFAYMNMFLAFMLVLVTANNFLMMFVGWEGVGVCSYLLIGFWWDRGGEEGEQKTNAAWKAMIANRVGDFGLLMAMFMIFFTFGTLDFFRPGEVVNVPLAQINAGVPVDLGHGEESHGEADEEHAATEDEHSEEGAVAEDDHAETTDDHGEAVATAEHGEEDAHGAEDDGHGSGSGVVYTDNTHLDVNQLGIFNQAEALVALDEGESLFYGISPTGEEVERTRMVDLGPFEWDIETVLTIVTLFMLLGVAGKSAQIPLFVWLPDAMAGPTSASALIHAATMVTSGIYMMVRANVFYDIADLSAFIVTVIGVSTALVAGFIALGQWDIKRVLAYSTVSQLGFMVAAVGMGAYVAAIFHLLTHACFKALLFLGSGSVIHGVEHGHHEVHAHHAHDDEHSDEHHHEEEFDPQDMRNMGGLRHKMPITFWTYVIGALALAGLPPLAGFWSKDEILADAFHVGFEEAGLASLGGFIGLGGLLIAAGFTAFYMWRQIELVFFGKARTEAAEHAHESDGWMTLPLVVLAVLSIIIGFINVPKGILILDGIFEPFDFKHQLEYSIVSVTRHATVGFNYLVAFLATGLGLVAIFVARSIYGHGKAPVDGKDPLYVQQGTRMAWSFANARMYWDQVYDAIFVRPFVRIATFFADTLDWNFLHDYFHDSVLKRGFDSIAQLLSEPFDLGFIDAIVNGIGWVVRQFSGRLRRVQTGYVRTYAVALLLGVVAVIIVMLLPLLNGS